MSGKRYPCSVCIKLTQSEYDRAEHLVKLYTRDGFMNKREALVFALSRIWRGKRALSERHRRDVKRVPLQTHASMTAAGTVYPDCLCELCVQATRPQAQP